MWNYIENTKGLTVTFKGERYILLEDINWEDPAIDWNKWPNEPKTMAQPLAQVKSVSRPDAAIEMYWEAGYPDELDAWAEEGDFNDSIVGVIEMDDD